MIRRRSPRNHGQFQDFHFFAAGDPTRTIANLESQFSQLAQPPAEPQPPVAPQSESAPVSSHPRAFSPAIAPHGIPSDAPGTIDVRILPENLPALARKLSMRLGSEESESDESRDCADSAIADCVDRLGKLRTALAPPQRKRKRAAKSSVSRPAARKSTARLATPRRTQARKARLPVASKGLASHETQCTVCTHPCRAEIENEFVHWHTIGHIAYDYKVSRSALYRHAYALGLFSQRNRLLRFSLGHLIDRVQEVEPTADSIVRAVHLFARINDEGECVEPPAHVIVSSGGIRREAPAPSGRRPITIQLDSPALAASAAHELPPTSHQNAPEAVEQPASKGGTVDRPSDHATR